MAFALRSTHSKTASTKAGLWTESDSPSTASCSVCAVLYIIIVTSIMQTDVQKDGFISHGMRWFITSLPLRQITPSKKKIKKMRSLRLKNPQLPTKMIPSDLSVFTVNIAIFPLFVRFCLGKKNNVLKIFCLVPNIL